MKLTRLLLASSAVVVALTLSACAAPAEGGKVIAPVVKTADELQGATVVLLVDQVLDIDTGDLAVDSYTAKVDDPAVAEFVQGRTEGSATFNPGVTALAKGSTTIVLTNAQSGIQPLTFTIEVSAAG